ncbi:MAG: hypothetical protein K6G42_03880 [Lachnospiraceae bacterium]|nr:hypothetical protein [Lachnospiraceae bacterium]
MKIRGIIMALTFMLLLSGCAGKQPDQNAAQNADQNAGESGEQGNTAQVANPWKYGVSAEDVKKLTGMEFIVPEGAENVSYAIMEAEGLAEMKFDLDGMSYCARMKPAEKSEDISGLYFDNKNTEDVEINGAAGTEFRAENGGETVDCVQWYDDMNAMTYSLSTSGKDLDGFDITAVASQMYGADE